jgi:preprotein translocase subunit SecG
MVTFLVILFVFIFISMVIVILLQASKGQGLAGTFGGAGASAVFGGRGAATFLSKSTAILAVTYVILCLLIGYFYKRDSEVARQSLIQQESETQSEVPVPGVPLAPLQPSEGDTTN